MLFPVNIVTTVIVNVVALIWCFASPDYRMLNDVLTTNNWRWEVDQNNTRIREIYLYNWTNIDEFSDGATIPNFEEIGPFRFVETQWKMNVIWSNNDVTYARTRTWVYEKDSNLDFNRTMITNVNVLLVFNIIRAENETNALKRREWDHILGNRTILATTRSALEWIDGYIDRRIPPIPNLTFPSVEFGHFLRENGTIDGIWNRDKYYHLSTYRAFDEPNSLLSFTGPSYFSDASIPLTYFEPDICSAVHLYPQNQNKYQGVGINEFGLTNDTVMNYLTHFGNISESCVKGKKPFVISLPHYAGRDNPNLTGLNTQDTDWPHAKIDYTAGLELNSHFTYQRNVIIEPISWSTTYLQNIPRLEIPLLWYSDDTFVPEDVIEVIIQLQSTSVASICVLSVCLVWDVLFVVHSILTIRSCARERKELLLEDDDSSDRDSQ